MDAGQENKANAAAEEELNDLERGKGIDGKARQHQHGAVTASSSINGGDPEGEYRPGKVTGPGVEEEKLSSDSWTVKARKHLLGEVDSNWCTVQLSLFCLLTGWTDAISFAAAYIFSGFQTGNTVQLAAALARLFSGPDQNQHGFHVADKLALTSLISFVLGAAIGQIGDRIGPKRRLWLIGCTMLQAGLMMGAFVCVLVSDQPSYATDRGDVAWSDTVSFVALGLASAQMGMQGIVAKRLNTHYGTTVVLTTIWCELIADPGLLHWRHRVPARDQKILAVLMLFIGALVGRILVGTLGGGAAFGIGAGVKGLVALSFWFVPSKVVKKQ